MSENGARPERPAGFEHLPAPDRDAAMAMAGVLFHYVGGSEELCGRLAAWAERHDGDLDAEAVRWYLGECHALLEPRCTEPLDCEMHPGRAR